MTSIENKKIVVYGTGGVGGYFEGILAKNGLNLTFISRGEHLNKMKKEGLRVDSVDGDFVVKPIQVTNNPTEVGPVDLVMISDNIVDAYMKVTDNLPHDTTTSLQRDIIEKKPSERFSHRINS